MTGRAAAIQGGLAAVGLLAALRHLAARAGARARRGDGDRRDQDRTSRRVHYDGRRQRASTSSAARRAARTAGLDCTWSPSRRPRRSQQTPTRSRRPSRRRPSRAPPAPPRDLAGADDARKLLDQFAPLVSPRAFGVLDAAKLKELGLDAPTRKLDVTVKGDVRHYVIGQPDEGAGGEAFLRDTARRARLPDAARDARRAAEPRSHLVDRRLHSFEPGDFDRMCCRRAASRRSTCSSDREARAKAGFAPAKTPDKRDQMAKNWHDAALAAFPTEILGKGEEPAGGKPTVAAARRLLRRARAPSAAWSSARDGGSERRLRGRCRAPRRASTPAPSTRAAG